MIATNQSDQRLTVGLVDDGLDHLGRLTAKEPGDFLDRRMAGRVHSFQRPILAADNLAAPENAIRHEIGIEMRLRAGGKLRGVRDFSARTVAQHLGAGDLRQPRQTGADWRPRPGFAVLP